jgi:hypothetical protein
VLKTDTFLKFKEQYGSPFAGKGSGYITFYERKNSRSMGVLSEFARYKYS